MEIIDAYIDPILQVALERKRLLKGSPTPDEKDASTLLDHLVEYTEGTYPIFQVRHAKHRCRPEGHQGRDHGTSAHMP